MGGFLRKKERCLFFVENLQSANAIYVLLCFAGMWWQALLYAAYIEEKEEKKMRRNR